MDMQRKQGLVRTLIYFAAANLAWESVQIPLYTIWAEGWGTIAYAVVHCTAGDVLIGGVAMLAALFAFGREWPQALRSRVLVIILATTLGVAYTIFSEWLNVEVRASWAYGPGMPIVPFVGTGLAPLAQWLLIPPLALWFGPSGQERKARHSMATT